MVAARIEPSTESWSEKHWLNKDSALDRVATCIAPTPTSTTTWGGTRTLTGGWGSEISSADARGATAGYGKTYSRWKRRVSKPTPPPEEKIMSEKPVRCWGWSRYGETYRGDFATREEAIEEGRGCVDGPFWVAGGRKELPSGFMPTAQDILELAGQTAIDSVGEAAEDWPDPSVEATKELDRLLADWANEHCPVSFYSVISETVERIGEEPGAVPGSEDR
jgi:hypothetical protein